MLAACREGNRPLPSSIRPRCRSRFFATRAISPASAGSNSVTSADQSVIVEPVKRCLASFHSPSGGPCSFANWNTRGRTPASHPALIAQHASPTAWAPRRRCRVAPPVQQCAVRCAPRRTRRALDRSAAKRHREARSSRRADPSRPCQADRGLRHRRQSSRPWLRRREYRSINGGTRPARLRASRSVRPVSRASWLNRGLSSIRNPVSPGR